MHPDGTIQSEALTPALILNCDWRDHDQQTLIARFVMALRISLKSLNAYYDDLEKKPKSIPSEIMKFCDHDHRAPHPHQYTTLGIAKEEVEFRYVKALFSNRLVFEVKECNSERTVIVKFTDHYNTGAHRALDEHGLAPRLLGYDELAGGWLMITMERLSKDWIMLENLPQEKRQPYRKGVEDALDKLHKAGYVHGDVRAANILVQLSSSELEVKIIDFDEAGPADKATYPPFWNTEITRPADAVEGAHLQMAHDDFMVNEIFGEVLDMPLAIRKE